MTSKMQIRTGRTLDEIGKDVIAAWHKAELGETTSPDYILGFQSMTGLLKVLTPGRWRLIETLAAEEKPITIYALAKKLGRDYKNVYRDVAILLEDQIIAQDADKKIFIPWEEITVNLVPRHTSENEPENQSA